VTTPIAAARLRRVFERVQTDERGITLMELIVAMALSLIIVVAAAGFLGASQKAQVTVNKIGLNTRVSGNVMNEMGRMLRGATENPEQNADADDAFIAMQPSSVTFYAFVNLASTSETKPQIVQFTVTPAGQLQETTWASAAVPGQSGYWTYPSFTSPSVLTGGTTRILANAVATSSTSPFSYVDTNGLPTADTGDVRAVVINLEIGSTTVGAYSNVVTRTTVALTNVIQENAS
jgi:type II secretory pathway pseudopilin PulG